MASGSQPNDRKVLRQDYHQLEERLQGPKDDLLNLETDMLQNFILQTSCLQQKEHHPREMAVGSRVFRVGSELAVQGVRHLTQKNTGCTHQAVLAALKSKYAPDGSNFNWKLLGEHSSHLFRLAPCMSTLFGPLEVEHAARVRPQKRAKLQLPDLVTPQDLQNAPQKDKQETDQNLTDMWSALKQVTSTPLLELVMDHQSFGQTVENTFALQFLVKDNRVSLTHNAHMGTVVTALSSAATQEAQKQRQQGLHFVLHWDHALWEEMKKVVRPEQCLMKHRRPPQPAGGAAANRL